MSDVKSERVISAVLADVLDRVEVSNTLIDVVDEVEVRAEVEETLNDALIQLLENTPPEERIHEVSSEHVFDYDGCIGNNQEEKKTPQELVESDKGDRAFWAEVRKTLHDETKGLPRDRRCVSSGSARQSKPADDFCAAYNQSTTSFQMFDYLSGYLDAQIDKLLLADIKGGLKTGTSFDRALDAEYEGVHEDWYFDESKISLLYQKMHRSAMCNESGLALVTFYDDRTDILNGLYDFFTKNIDLVPPNLILYLCRRERGGPILERYPAIVGYENRATAKIDFGIDYDYKTTVLQIGRYIDAHATDVPEGRAPMGIHVILHELPLAMFIRAIRLGPAFAEKVIESAQKKCAAQKLRVGNMIFSPPSEEARRQTDENAITQNHAREISREACDVDKMFSSTI
ncbi:MAG: hypothetical protein P1U32_01115 [Legionellaceae bacterium]|nr:hypothetical protein [Legionellaceae bacterium]